LATERLQRHCARATFGVPPVSTELGYGARWAEVQELCVSVGVLGTGASNRCR
jgi:hypothetical protein